MQKTPSRKTGPNTPHGKETSSKNSSKHGLRGNPAKLLPGETQEDYNAVRDIWFAEYESGSPATAQLLEPVINDDRLVRFSTNAVIDAQIALYEAQSAPEPDQVKIELLHKDLKNKLRYKTQHERSFQRSLRNIEQFGQRRVREKLAAQRNDIIQHGVVCRTAMQCHSKGIDYRVILHITNPAMPTPETDVSSSEEENPPNRT